MGVPYGGGGGGSIPEQLLFRDEEEARNHFRRFGFATQQLGLVRARGGGIAVRLICFLLYPMCAASAFGVCSLFVCLSVQNFGVATTAPNKKKVLTPNPQSRNPKTRNHEPRNAEFK